MSVKINLVLSKVETVAFWIGALSIVGMLVLMSAGMAVRALFDSSIHGNLQVVSYLMVAATFLPLGWLERESGHVSVNLFERRVSGRYRRIYRIAVQAIKLVIVSALTYAVYQLVANYFVFDVRAGRELDVPLYAVGSIMLVGFALLVLRLVLSFFGEEEDVDDQAPGI